MYRFLTRSQIIIVLALIALMTSCDSEAVDLILDEVDGQEYRLYDEYVDEYGNVGVVAYVSSGKLSSSNYIMVISANESSASWGIMGKTVFPADSVSSGIVYNHQFGICILQKMCELGIDQFPAQQWCNLMNNGKEPYSGSWHLPTQYEIRNMVSTNINGINETLEQIGYPSISKTQLYWTCVEDFVDYIEFDNPSIGDLIYDPDNRAIPVTAKYSTSYNKVKWLKKIKYNVRAVKFIYYKK